GRPRLHRHLRLRLTLNRHRGAGFGHRDRDGRAGFTGLFRRPPAKKVRHAAHGHQGDGGHKNGRPRGETRTAVRWLIVLIVFLPELLRFCDRLVGGPRSVHRVQYHRGVWVGVRDVDPGFRLRLPGAVTAGRPCDEIAHTLRITALVRLAVLPHRGPSLARRVLRDSRRSPRLRHGR